MNGLTMKSRRKSKNVWKQTKMNTQQLKSVGHSEGNPERNSQQTGLPKKTGKYQINNLTLQLQELEKQQQIKPRASRRKEIIKIRAKLQK